MPKEIDMTPSPEGMVNILLRIILDSTSKTDKEYARQQLIKAMTLAYRHWYPRKKFK